jgi:WD40 repeat protein
MSSSGTDVMGAAQSSTMWKTYVPVPSRTCDGANDIRRSDQGDKRRKLSTSGTPAHQNPQGGSVKTGTPTAGRSMNGPKQAAAKPAGREESDFTTNAQPGPTHRRLVGKMPSVQYMNAALKTNGAITTLPDNVVASGPRPLQIGRISSNGEHASSRPISTLPESTLMTSKITTPRLSNNARYTHEITPANESQSKGMHLSQVAPQTASRSGFAKRATGDDRVQSFTTPSFSGTASVPEEDDKDSAMSDVSVPSTGPLLETATKPTAVIPSPPAAAPRRIPVMQNPAELKHTGPFSEEEEHLLIFLKEIKRLQWKGITEAFSRDFPGRAYHTLQSRYTTKTNKRDRSQDPAVLNLPDRWAAEAVFDWATVHGDNPGPRERSEVTKLRRDTGTTVGAAPRPTVLRQTTETESSSGTDSGPRLPRPRRAPVVNYDVRRRYRRSGFEADGIDIDDVTAAHSVDMDSHMRSETPPDTQAAPPNAIVVINEPLQMNFDVEDASITLVSRGRTCETPSQQLPYLEASHRSLLQNVPEGWDWDQLASREWQGLLIHVDFSPAEMEQVELAAAEVQGAPQRLQHSTQRRQLRTILRKLTEPKLLQLTHTIRRRMSNRNSASISALLRDALAGNLADQPRIMRLSAARPMKATSTLQVESTMTMVRQRELGAQSRRGWKTASKPLTYQAKNKIMDTLGPLSSWTGGSSDIHTVAWNSSGDHFAAGAVAVTDQDSMQYNRPNNLLYGILPTSTIHELAEHSTERKKTEKGANSSHAMFASQDPKLYTTVTSVAFSPSGKVMYSAGYDESVCIWNLESTSSQPALAAKLRHKAEVELMVVNRNYPGVLATAAKISSGNAVKLITLNEDDPAEFTRHNFFSAKASERADLRILPQALQFEPKLGEMLLAGFGANVRKDNGFDTTGDLCLWDITTQTQLPIHKSNGNVFDIAFNPNCRYMPLFAAACVAGGNVNRGTRSVIRLYEERSADRYGSPLEIECRALDMNELVWSPQDEHLIAAGCTDGRVYVWDMRNSDDPLQVLSHGRSLMPLQDDIHHERTDTGVRFLSWGENATRLYSGSSDGVVKVWDVLRSGEDTFVKDLITLDSGIMAGAFSPDYSKLVLGEVNGSVDVLDVGRDDYSIKDANRMRYVRYAGEGCDEDSITGNPVDSAAADSGVAEGKFLLQTQQLQVVSMGNLPIRQVVQGMNYNGPYDQGVDAPTLRELALQFQMGMAKPSGPQCAIATCKDNIVMMTSEEIGDSHRSSDRIPDELRVQWTALNTAAIISGKSKCTHCSRPARPCPSTDDPEAPVLCERCSFACFRCDSVNPVATATTTLTCGFCAGVWEIGALGYECVEQPALKNSIQDVPSLKRFGRDMLEERWDEGQTSFGDEVNALTEYYYSLAIDRPESPPL